MTPTAQQVDVFPQPEALTLAAAERLALLANNAVEDHGVFTVALSGGSTPKALYQLIAADDAIRGEIPWPKVHFFFGDEQGGIVYPKEGGEMQPGNAVTCIVPHCDPTVNLYDVYHAVRGDRLEAIWPIEGRGRSA